MRNRIVAVSLVLIAAVACLPAGSGPTVDQPAGAFITTAPFTTTLPNDMHITRPPGNTTNCAPGSNVDIARTVSGTATANLGDLGPTATLASGIRDVGATVPDGRYVWSNRPLNVDCFQTGPTAGPFTASFAISYRAEVDQDNQPDVCVVRSRMEFSSFTVTGLSPIDSDVEARVKSEAHQGVDSAIADRMNRFVNGRPLPPGADPRCSGWSTL